MQEATGMTEILPNTSRNANESAETLLAPPQTAEEVSAARTFMEWDRGQITVEEVIRRFEVWNHRNLRIYLGYGDEVFWKLAAKRGNPIYSWMLRVKLEEIAELLTPEIRVDELHTNAVFFTGTYPHRSKLNPDAKSASQSWRTVRLRWNRKLRMVEPRVVDPWNLFLQNIRKGHDILFLKSWESHEDGYPHFHAEVIFRDCDFRTQLRWDRNERKMVSRVHGAAKWKTHWKGRLDVRGCETTTGAVWYITKEILKYETDTVSVKDTKSRQTLALMWAARRRSFSMSQELTRKIAAKRKERRELHEKETEDAKRPLVGVSTTKSNSNCSMHVLGLPIKDFDRKKLVFLGVGFESETVKWDIEGTPKGAWSGKAIGPPEGLRLPHRKPLPTSEHQGVLLCRGSEITDPNKLERYIDGPVYDELTRKQRGRMKEMVPGWTQGTEDGVVWTWRPRNKMDELSTTIRAGREGEAPARSVSSGAGVDAPSATVERGD
jgi:hypothetical protein